MPHPLTARLREAAGAHARCCLGVRKCAHALALEAADALDAYHEAEQRAESPEHEKQVREDLLQVAQDLDADRWDEEGAGTCRVAEAHIGMLRRMLTDARARGEREPCVTATAD